jgi:hypothetical protein
MSVGASKKIGTALGYWYRLKDASAHRHAYSIAVVSAVEPICRQNEEPTSGLEPLI